MEVLIYSYDEAYVDLFRCSCLMKLGSEHQMHFCVTFLKSEIKKMNRKVWHQPSHDRREFYLRLKRGK